MSDEHNKPTTPPTNTDTGTPLPSADPEVPPLREDYGGPRTASDGTHVAPNTSEPPSAVPLPSSDGVERRGTDENNMGAPASSRTGSDDAEHRQGRSGSDRPAGWSPTSRRDV